MFSIEDSNTDDVINLNLTSFSEVGHTHEITDVNKLETKLDIIMNLVNSINFEGESTISIDLTNYSEVGHTHTTADITDLSTNYSKRDHTHESTSITDFQKAIVNLVYQVGSIYTSMDSTSPSEKFGGTWEQIVDRFLYCASSSGATGGSSTITEANLPSHTHTFSNTNVSDSLQFGRAYESSSSTILNLLNTSGSSNPVFTVSSSSSSSTSWANFVTSGAVASSSIPTDQFKFNYTPAGTLSSSGSGEEFMPPYLTVYCWRRTS